MTPLIFLALVSTFACSCEGAASFSHNNYRVAEGATVKIECVTDSRAIAMDQLQNVSSSRTDFEWKTVTNKYGESNNTQVAVNKTFFSLKLLKSFVSFDDFVETNDSRIIVSKKFVDGKTIWMLIIRNAMQSDRGIYSCIEQNWSPFFIVNETDSTKYAYLRVFKPNGAERIAPISLTVAVSVLIGYL